MAAVVGALRAELRAEVAQFIRDMGRAGDSTGLFSSKTRTSFRAIGAAGAVVGGAIAAVGAAAVALGQRGSEIAAIETSFQALTSAAGLAGDQMISLTQGATKGLIDNLTIMEAANKGLLLGLPITEQSMADLSSTATVLGRAMGQDAVKSLDDLITALGRSSPLILDNLGLTVSVADANKAYADELGKTTQQLTDAEKKQAFYNAAMDAAKAKVEELGGITLTFGDRITILQQGFKNFTDQLSIAVARAPALASLLDQIGALILASFGSNSQAAVDRIVALLDDFVMFLGTSAQVALSTAGIIGRVWNGLQLVFSGTMSIVASLGLVFLELIRVVNQAASHIPLIGGEFGKVADAAEDLSIHLGGVQQSFHDQAQEALDGVTGNSEFQQSIAGLKTELGDMQDKMRSAVAEERAARAATDELDEAVEDLEPSVRAAAGATGELRDRQTELSDSASILKTRLNDILGPVDLATVALPAIGGLAEQSMLQARNAAIEANGGFVTLNTTLAHTQVVLPAIDGLANPPGGFFRGMIDSITGPGGLLEAMADTFGAGGGLSGLIQTGLGFAEGAFQSFATNALSAVSMMIPGIGPIISQFSGQIISGLSAMAGGVVGIFRGIGSAISGLFGRDMSDNIVLTFERMFGIDIPDAVAEGLVPLSKKVGEFEAMILSLGDVFTQMGGLAAVGFEEGAAAARVTFSLIQEGRISSESGFKSLGVVLGQFADGFDDMGDVAKARFFELIQLAVDFGFEVDDLVSIIGQDLVDQALNTDLSGAVRDADDNIIALSDSTQTEAGKMEEAIGDVEHSVDELDKAVGGSEGKIGRWGGLGVQVAGDVARAVGAVGDEALGIQAKLDAIDWDDWSKKGITALDAVTASATAVTWGKSPGGLKDIPPMLERSIEKAGEFERDVTNNMEGAKRSIDRLSSTVGGIWRGAERGESINDFMRRLEERGGTREAYEDLVREFTERGAQSFIIPFPLASGGIVTKPTLSIIGERGPEAVIPLERGGLRQDNLGVERILMRLERQIRRQPKLTGRQVAEQLGTVA